MLPLGASLINGPQQLMSPHLPHNKASLSLLRYKCIKCVLMISHNAAFTNSLTVDSYWRVSLQHSHLMGYRNQGKPMSNHYVHRTQNKSV